MGQDGFIKFVSEIAAAKGISFETALSLLKLSGYRVAIDGFIWVNANMAIPYRYEVEAMTDPVDGVIDRAKVVRETVEKFVKYNINLIQYGILPLWCWDGKIRPEKQKTLEKRKATKKKTDKTIDELLKELRATPILLRDAEKLKSLVMKLKYTARPTRPEIEMYQNVAHSIGIPSIIAPYDGEALCASLSQEGLVAAVASDDADNYPIGSIYLVDGYAPKTADGIPHFKARICPYIPYAMGLTQEQFRDWFILCGTDFNFNIKGIGQARAYEAIKKYGNIETFLTQTGKATPENIELLNYVKVREILTPFKTGYDNDSPEINFNYVKFAQSREFLESMKLDHHITLIDQLVRLLPKPKLVEMKQPEVAKTAKFQIVNTVSEEKEVTKTTTFTIVSSTTISNKRGGVTQTSSQQKSEISEHVRDDISTITFGLQQL